MNLIRARTAAVDAARAAGLLMRLNLRAAKRVNAESSHDIKLELDVRCQRLIEARLRRSFPQVGFLGEEETAGSRRHRTAEADPEFRWVVDPIDGTVNFASGLPHASVSIALQAKVRGAKYKTILGVVYDPFMDELWTALRGKAALLNGTPIHVSLRRDLAQCMVSIGFAKSRSSLGRALPYFIWLARRVRKIRMLGSAALGLTYVATGRLDAYVERGVNLWDVAAGGLIVECAGGRFWSEPTPEGKIRMIASNGRVHSKLKVPQ